MQDKEDKLEEKNETVKPEDLKEEPEKNPEGIPVQLAEETKITEERAPGFSPEPSIQMDTITELLKYAISLIENKISYDETKEKMFQALYQQLKEYKEGLLETLQKPIIKAILPLYDSIVRLEEEIHNQDLSREYLKNEVRVVKSEMEEALYRMDVTLFPEHPDMLNRQLHKTIKVIETSDPMEDKKVVEILKYGFFWKGNILRPEEIIIKRYIPQKGG